MKKVVLLLLLAGLVTSHAAHAQLGMLVRTGMNIHTLATRNPADKDAANGLTTTTYEGKTLRLQRTPPDKLPKKGAEQITTLETELERCHAALLASPTGVVCPPEQRTALQQALVAVARTGQAQHVPVYQEEAAFYLAEDARRQQAAAAPVK